MVKEQKLSSSAPLFEHIFLNCRCFVLFLFTEQSSRSKAGKQNNQQKEEKQKLVLVFTEAAASEQDNKKQEEEQQRIIAASAARSIAHGITSLHQIALHSLSDI